MDSDCSHPYSCYSIELMSIPDIDYRRLEREMSIIVKDWQVRQDKLSDRAHMLRKKWLPSRPKKVRWRKG